MKRLLVPVLIIGFNRPEIIRQTFEYVKNAQPEKLYVAIDAARKNYDGEDRLVSQVKTIVENVDWECEAHYMYNENNKGAEITVSSAVTWALKNEKYVIVLEDDIIAPQSFFSFAQEMLFKYEKTKNVYMISSYQITPIKMPNDEDYLFCIFGHTLGWATWRRAWDRFDLNINDFDKYLTGIIDVRDNFPTKKAYQHFLRRTAIMKSKGAGNNTWDRCWSYIRMKEGGLSIVPKVNLSSNIGEYGLHAKGKEKYHYLKYDECFEAKIHPKSVEQNFKYDRHHFNKYLIRPSLVKRVINKIILLCTRK